MDFRKLQDEIARLWDAEVLPALFEYVAIPCVSPAFDPQWAANGHMDRAMQLMARWAREKLAGAPGATVETLQLAGRTPLLIIDIPGEGGPGEGGPGEDGRPVLIYGHLDKQPAMEGWAPGRGAWTPTLEGDRLYGRGGADDGYAAFGAIAAVLALRAESLRHPRCIILIEASEESSSVDLPFYVELLAPRLSQPSVIVALDAGCGTYEQLWATTSLRGQVAGVLSVRMMTEGVHSGDASGIVPSSFRIARHLLSRLEDPATGEILVPDFHVEIPAGRRAQAAIAAAALGPGLYKQLPLLEGARPASQNLTELLLNRTWRPQLAITGVDGVPNVANAAAVMQPHFALKLSLRLPPTLPPEPAALRLKALLEADPPYGSDVAFTLDFASKGWEAPSIAPWLEASLNKASRNAFGPPCAYMGGGGGIPFLAMLGERFPDAQFVATGVLGPKSNAHGPNEFLHLPTAKRITAAVAQILHDAR